MNALLDKAAAIENGDLHYSLWRTGDIVSRDGSDEHRIIETNHGANFIEVECIKEPWADEGEVPWTRLGEREGNMIYRYSFVRHAK